ncbi:hypothetical protein CHELA20_52667 [Hyphomicrobiales bacterium]|nr:hypothetical protein CHELA41_22260 [Hyphomicrobiales bacterium]CAH1682559.1 hypothetical protein CHELA20_52667 [Hyphomicrobiales bacterium]
MYGRSPSSRPLDLLQEFGNLILSQPLLSQSLSPGPEARELHAKVHATIEAAISCEKRELLARVVALRREWRNRPRACVRHSSILHW